ncbi:hypothetical protein Vafri_17024, partial [Volvox africanus]
AQATVVARGDGRQVQALHPSPRTSESPRPTNPLNNKSPTLRERVLQLNSSPETQAFYQKHCQNPRFESPNNLYWRKSGNHQLLVIPDDPETRQYALQMAHDPPYSGHGGRNRTLKNLQLICWWPHMHQDVNNYVTSCGDCQRNKPSNKHPQGLLEPLPIPGRRWESVSMDLITQLPKTRKNHDAIIVFVDRLSKMVHLAPTTTSCTAEDVAHLFTEHVWKHHGLPKTLVTDRDVRFTSAFAKELCHLTGIQQLTSTAFHPQTDGQTERTNRILEEYLRHYINPTQDNWDTLLVAAEFAINNSYQESIKTTPFMLNYGQHPLTPLSVDIPTPNLTAHNFNLRLKEAVRNAKSCLAEAQAKQKHFADRHRTPASYNPGDLVLLSTKNLRNLLNSTTTRKFLPRWVGPFPITEKIGTAAYKLQLPPSWQIHLVFHISLLRMWKDDGCNPSPPPPELINGQLEHEVQAILDHKPKKPGKSPSHYLIKWMGYGVECNTWEPARNLTNCPQ